MKVGDLIRWIGPVRPHSIPTPGKYGLVVSKDGVFFQILWEDGAINGNIERQMEVVCEDGKTEIFILKEQGGGEA